MKICKKHQEEKNPESGICPICRNERTLEAVTQFTDYDGSGNIDLETGIYDLMADLLHLARDNGIDPGETVRMAKMHFEAEVIDAENWKCLRTSSRAREREVDCQGCGFKKGMMNSARGKKLPGGGKCTYPGGFCPDKEACKETPGLLFGSKYET